ncbi:hypothetical protein LTR56_013238 [Elasticomyces elasticus]|nr:hypothetical protein LTR56_013238 [Elasticomyces elasticus]KAK3650095.1 hypothetical protein LTR22_012690 [Elasticomyces elasticus]KAK4920069.1 hypothetical protein LTR49_012330 [Elasticomyces elasticus]KAK5757207.1 hypothetical protein LTS12_012723 [Elasticomyces elasticus]
MWGNPWMRGMYGIPSQLYPMAGAMPADQWAMEDGDYDEEDLGGWTTAGRGPGKKYALHLQRAGLIGPMVQAPGLGPYGGVAIPPWMAPGFEPRGGFYGSPEDLHRRSNGGFYGRGTILNDRGETLNDICRRINKKK